MNKKALSKLNSCVLVSESETNLKSADDYKAVLNLEFECCPQLIPYLNTFVIPSPGDWPTWYFVKKLIAHSDEHSALNSIIPEQGPFHVILNATEDTVILFHFFSTSCIDTYLETNCRLNQNHFKFLLQQLLPF